MYGVSSRISFSPKFVMCWIQNYSGMSLSVHPEIPSVHNYSVPGLCILRHQVQGRCYLILIRFFCMMSVSRMPSLGGFGFGASTCASTGYFISSGNCKLCSGLCTSFLVQNRSSKYVFCGRLEFSDSIILCLRPSRASVELCATVC